MIGGMTKMKDNEVPWGKNVLEIIDDVTKNTISQSSISQQDTFRIIEL
jgi:hypothetical protein